MRKTSSPALYVVVVWGLPLTILLACNTAFRRTPEAKAPDEVSLAADRTEYDKLRKDIPEEKRQENDELALILQSIHQNSGSNEEPGRIRERFNRVMRDRRDKHDKNLRKRREEASKADKAKRDEFLNAMKKDRATYMNTKSKKATPSERQAFFTEQEQRRQAYFSAEADRRREFESIISDERRTFEDQARETTNRFNEEMRNYTTAYYDRKKAETLKKATEKKAASAAVTASGPTSEGAPMVQPASLTDKERALLEEFKSIPQGPATQLGPSDQ